MFSIKTIKAKLTKKAKKKSEKQSLQNKNKASSFLSLETKSTLFKKDNEGEHIMAQPVPKKKGSSSRYFNKLAPNTVVTGECLNIDIATPSDSVQSEFLKLTGTNQPIDSVKKTNPRIKRKKKSGKKVSPVICVENLQMESVDKNLNLDDHAAEIKLAESNHVIKKDDCIKPVNNMEVVGKDPKIKQVDCIEAVNKAADINLKKKLWKKRKKKNSVQKIGIKNKKAKKLLLVNKDVNSQETEDQDIYCSCDKDSTDELKILKASTSSNDIKILKDSTDEIRILEASTSSNDITILKDSTDEVKILKASTSSNDIKILKDSTDEVKILKASVTKMNTQGDIKNLPLKRSFSSSWTRRQTPLTEQDECNKGVSRDEHKMEVNMDNFISLDSKLNNNLEEEGLGKLHAGINKSLEDIDTKDSELQIDFTEDVKNSPEPDVNKPSKSIESEVSNLKLTTEESMDVDNNIIFSNKNQFYLDTLKISEDALLVAFLPGSELFFCGSIWVKLLVGSISVLGYQFEEGDLYPVFSPPSHSLLNIKVLEGKNIKLFSSEELQNLHISIDWIKRLNIEKNSPVAIVKLCRFENSSTRLVTASNALKQSICPTSSDRVLEEILGIRVVDRTKNFRNLLHCESPAWNLYAESLLLNITKDPRIIIAGGKGVGKSTFFKYLMNKLLSHESVDQVACIDIDPGQPEFSLPTVLSFTKVCDPALGPAHTHMDGMNLSDQTQLLVGDLSVVNVLQYLSIVKRLEHIYSKKYSNIPLLVNTMGFTSGAGLDIIVDVLRIIKPTHVIVIESRNPEYNFDHQLNHDFVNSTKRGILEKLSSSSIVLNYEFKCMVAVTGEPQIRCGNLTLRELRSTSYLSKLWADEQQQINASNCIDVIKVPWALVAIHVIGVAVPVERILEAVDASLVALCHVKEEYIEDVAEEVPRQIQKSSHWYNSCKCLGWGIVRKIDLVSRDLHILTTLSDSVLMLEVNTLIVTKNVLPVYFSNLFFKGAVPYTQRVNNVKRNKFQKHKKYSK